MLEGADAILVVLTGSGAGAAMAELQRIEKALRAQQGATGANLCGWPSISAFSTWLILHRDAEQHEVVPGFRARTMRN